MTKQSVSVTQPNRRNGADVLAVLLLVALCWLFNWRMLTAAPANQQSLVEGDFSGQFVAFAHYQITRLGQGEVPLWNPYNFGGHPFLADTQAAVFYPPRLLFAALLNATGGPTPQRVYMALQNEMVLHMLIASLLMYTLLRRLTCGRPYSIPAALAAGITFAYGGYLTGYPQLQLAVMEAGVWLPLALIGLTEFTRTQASWRWLLLAGAALGLSFMAGHPQTTLFFLYVSVGYLATRTVIPAPQSRPAWLRLVIGAGVFVLIGGGLAAVQLVPGWEYTRLTIRTNLTFDAMGNGFPFQDVLQMVFPGLLSLWSPLYAGIAALMLALYAIWRRVEGSIFWIVVLIIAFGLSFGHNTILYDLFYNLVPGFSLFRGQERSAYVIAVVVSILMGLGTNDWLERLQSGEPLPRGYGRLVWGIAAVAGGVCLGLFFIWLITEGSGGKALRLVMFSAMISTVTALLISGRWPARYAGAVLIALVAFELFSFGRTNPNLESRAAETRVPLSALVQAMQADRQGIFRVDGKRGLIGNYGSLFGLMDIQGISPLELNSVERLLKLPPARAWELFAVRYVPTEDRALPVPSTVITQESIRLDEGREPLKLHRLNDPRPFARLVYRTWIEPDDNTAFGILSDPSYDARNTVMLVVDPGLKLPDKTPAEAKTELVNFAPESITIRTTSPDPAILSVALIHYPGWQAVVDGQPAPILRADLGFSALALPGGDHTVQLTFRPPAYTLGAALSLITLGLTALGALVGLAPVSTIFRRGTAKPSAG